MCEFACVSMHECMCGSVCVKRFVDKNSVQVIYTLERLIQVQSGTRTVTDDVK